MKFFFTLLIALCSAVVYSQKIDTTIFKSNFEKEVFQNFADSLDTKPLDLFLCFGYEPQTASSIEKRIENFQQSLKIDVDGRTVKKQTKVIYKKTHEYFLKKYDEKSFFGDIFSKGNYNCVTASALYTLIFDYYHIDYIIKETPQHVYLIADPYGNQTVIESTLPSKGTFHFDDRYKKNYVDYLKENKIVSESEFKTRSVDDLFREHYDDNKTISITDLAGIQYYNDGLLSFENLEYDKAAISLEKANILYPSKTIKFVFHSALINLMNEQDKANVYSGKTLAKFLNINIKNNNAESLASDYFNLMTNEFVINHPNLNAFEVFYDELKEYTSDSVDLNQIDQTYYYYLAYSSYVNQKNIKALTSLSVAYKLNSENINTKQLINEVAAKHIMKDRNREKELDSLKDYFEIFPFLQDNDAFQNYTTYCYLRIISESIAHDDKTKALIFLDEFEELLRQNPKIALNESYVTSAYGAIASYYIQTTNYDEAENYFMKGIELAPNSYELKEGLKLLVDVKSDLNDYISQNKNSNNSYEIIPINSIPPQKLSFKETINNYLPGTWEAISYITNGKEEKVPSDEKMTITATKSKKLTVAYGTDKEEGRWAIRSKGNLLYWVYSEDGSDYEVFKVLELNSSILKIQEYDEQELSGEIIIFKSN